MILINCILIEIVIIILILVPAPSVSLFSNNPIWPIGSDVNLTCNVQLNPAVTAVSLSLLTVHIDFYRIQSPWVQIQGSRTTNITFIHTIQLNPFERNGSGNYICIATISSNISYLTDSNSVNNSIKISTG